MFWDTSDAASPPPAPPPVVQSTSRISGDLWSRAAVLPSLSRAVFAAGQRKAVTRIPESLQQTHTGRYPSQVVKAIPDEEAAHPRTCTRRWTRKQSKPSRVNTQRKHSEPFPVFSAIQSSPRTPPPTCAGSSCEKLMLSVTQGRVHAQISFLSSVPTADPAKAGCGMVVGRQCFAASRAELRGSVSASLSEADVRSDPDPIRGRPVGRISGPNSDLKRLRSRVPRRPARPFAAGRRGPVLHILSACSSSGGARAV